MIAIRLVGTLALTLTVLAGCSGGARLDARTLLAYDQCQGVDAGLTRVDYPDVAGIRGSTLLNLARDDEPAAGAAEGDSPALLIAISRGRQSTPGYGLSLVEARRFGNRAVIEVAWRTPESGAVLAQVVTHPCLVVGLPGQGLERVEAVDQSGATLGTLDL